VIARIEREPRTCACCANGWSRLLQYPVLMIRRGHLKHDHLCANRT